MMLRLLSEYPERFRGEKLYGYILLKKHDRMCFGGDAKSYAPGTVLYLCLALYSVPEHVFFWALLAKVIFQVSASLHLLLRWDADSFPAVWRTCISSVLSNTAGCSHISSALLWCMMAAAV